VAKTLWKLAADRAKAAREQEEIIEDLAEILPFGEYGKIQIKELAALLQAYGYRSPRS